MTRRQILFLIFILFSGLIIRVGAAAYWEARQAGDAKFTFGDSESYWYLARTIAQGKPYQFGSTRVRVFRTPGYPLILALLFYFSENDPSVFSARLINVGFGTLTIFLVFCLARELFDLRVAMISALIVAIYPGAIGMSVFVLSEAPFAMLMLISLLCLSKSLSALGFNSEKKSTNLAWAILCGVACAIATLIRPSWLLFPLVVLILLLFWKVKSTDDRSDQKVSIWMRINLCIAMLFAFCIIMSPWWIRNYNTVGHFVPTTLQSGVSLYDGMNPNADGSSDMSFAPGKRAEFKSIMNEKQIPEIEFEYEFNRYIGTEALNWAKNNPNRALQLAATKFQRMWSPFPNSDEFQSSLIRFGTFLSYTPLIVLAFFSLFFVRNFKSVLICLLPAFYFSAIHVVFVGSIRYREPAMLSIILLASAMISLLLNRYLSLGSQTSSDKISRE